ncbi:MAG: hypothetical protein WKF54_10080 [Nocardioidaceae bacterium]
MERDAAEGRTGQPGQPPVPPPGSAGRGEHPGRQRAAPERRRTAEPELRLEDQPDAGRELEDVVGGHAECGAEVQRPPHPDASASALASSAWA